MKITREEIFGPVAAIQRFESEDAVVDDANDCDAGLGSHVFTQDLNRAARVCETLHFGMVALNSGIISEASAPFGGIKQSGVGREGSKYGLEEYLEIKTIIAGNLNVRHRA